MKLIAKIEQLARVRAANPITGSPFDPTYPTFNVGAINGGAVRNGWLV